MYIIVRKFYNAPRNNQSLAIMPIQIDFMRINMPIKSSIL